MNSPRVLVVGSANIDLVTRVPRIPRPGESIIGHSFATFTGGKGANQAVAAARLGAETYFAGCVGKDAFGEMQRQSLSREGISLRYLTQHATEPTGTAVIFVADNGENAIVVTPAANNGVSPGDVNRFESDLREFDAVLLQLEIPLDTVEAVLVAAREAGVLTVLDAGPAQQVPAKLIELARIVSPNETEAEAMTGIAVTSVETARQAAANLIEQGAREVVVKMGGGGALYMSVDEWFHVPAFNVKPVDTVAAGDAFTAALALQWGARSASEAVRYANAAGALATLTAGAQPAMPTRDSVEKFLKSKEV
ncbi:MAG: ribokinase [Candidatus Hydrogenedentes bacterium]|nr:ribokinase [Candidatus Hydrogenedentota bacterium]